MMRSLSSAVGGLRAHQTKMDVIGNNIANVNTYGFKSSRVTFSDVYYQTLSGGSGPIETQGGTNPSQIGYGAMVASIDVLNSPSAAASTDRSLDIYIAGDGFICVQDSDGNRKFTRSGVLGFDAKGNLVDVNGNFVLGFPIDSKTGEPQIGADGTVDGNLLRPIQADPEILDQLTGISIGTKGEVTGRLPGEVTGEKLSGLPKWLAEIYLEENSDIVSDVKVKMAWEYNPPNQPLSLNWITEVKAMENSNAKGTYTFTYNGAAQELRAVSTTGDVLIGSYTRGGVIEMKRNGVTVMEVTTHNSNLPANGDTMSVNFQEQLAISYEATDRGGNKVGDKAYYNESDTLVKLGEGTTAVTVQINPNEALPGSYTQFDYNYGTHGISWLDTMYLAEGSDIDPGQISMDYGVVYTATSYAGTAAYSWVNGFDPADVTAMLEQYSSLTGYTGNFNITLEQNPANTYIMRIMDSSSPAKLIASGTFSSLPAPGDTDVTFTTWNNVVPTTPVSLGGMTSTTLNTVGGVPIDITTDAVPAGSPVSGGSLGVTRADNKVYLYNGTTMVGEANYTGGDVIRVGDFTMNVDGAALAAFFQANPTGGLVPTPVRANLGQINHIPRKDWLLDANAATTQVGDGELVVIGVIALASFTNALALKQDGNNYFVESSNSGEDVKYSRPGTNNTGSTTAGMLEMSNVDISKEFTDMITTQRGFQANTRIITVSDEMLQELVNLKR